MKVQRALQKEVDHIQRLMHDIESISIIDNHGVVIVSTMTNTDTSDLQFSKDAYMLLTTAKELTINMHKGALYQVMIKDQNGITFITEINTTLFLLVTTKAHVKYGLIEREVKRIAIDLHSFIMEQTT